MTPLVSVILIGYNQRPWLLNAIGSLLEQTYPNIDGILVDNGSTDGSDVIVRAYDRQYRIISERENRPPSTVLNEVLPLCRGEFISILYADDYYLPTKIARQVELFQSLPAKVGVVYGPHYRQIGETRTDRCDPTLTCSGRVLEPWLKTAAKGKGAIVNMIMPLVRRECFEQDRFNEAIFAEAEMIFWRFALSWEFHYDPQPLAVMRDHGNNFGRDLNTNLHAALVALDALISDARFPFDLLKEAWAYRARMLALFAWCALRQDRDRHTARIWYDMARRIDWHQWLEPKTLLGSLVSLAPPIVLDAMNAVLA